MKVYYTNFHPEESIEGKKGSAAFNTPQTAFVQLFKRSASPPDYPTGTPTSPVTYTFDSGLASGLSNGWEQEIPAGSDPVYVISVTITSFDTFYEILMDEWSTPILYITNITSVVMMELSNDNITVACDFDGSNPILTGAETSVSVFEGSAEVTNLWTISATPSAGVTGTFVSNTYTVTGFTTDTGTVTFLATRTGYPDKTIIFTLSKAFAGADGTPATIYSIATSAAVIKRSALGGYDPDDLTVESYSITGTTPRALYSGRFKIYTSNDGGTGYTLQYSSSTNQNSYTYTLPVGITHIKIELYTAGGFTTLVDYEIIPVVEDGADAIYGILVPSTKAVQAQISGAVHSYAPAYFDYAINAAGTNMSSYFTLSVTSNPQSLTYTITDMRVQVTSGFDELAETTATLEITATGSGPYLGINFVRIATLYKVSVDYNPSNNSNSTTIVDPVVASDGSAITYTVMSTGHRSYKFNWTWSGTESDIDGFCITVVERTVNTAYTFGSEPASERHYFVADPSKRSWPAILSNPDLYETYFVRAYRNVYKNISSTGLLFSNPVKSTASGQNPLSAYTANITATIAGTTAANVAAGANAANNGLTATGEVMTNKVVTTSILAQSVTKNGFTSTTGSTTLTTTYQSIASYTFTIGSGELLVTAAYLLNCVPTSSGVTFGVNTYIELTGLSNTTVTGDVWNISSYSSSIQSRIEQEVSFSQLFTGLSSDTITINIYAKKIDTNAGATSASKKRINYDQLKR